MSKLKKDIYNHDFEFIPFDNYLRADEKGLEERIEESPDDIKEVKDEYFLKDVLTEKIRFLREILTEIDNQMKDRETLKEKILIKINKGICYLRTQIYEIDSWGYGNNKSIDLRRSKIEKEVEALKKQKRDELRESWRDIALLRKEHREFFHQYRNALRRVKVIFPEKVKEDEK